MSESAQKVKVIVLNEDGTLSAPVLQDKIEKPIEAWQAQLTQEQFLVTRQQGTERPFCGTLLDNKLEGIYFCVCCGLPLFSSQHKFNSGTGWPSFFAEIGLNPDAKAGSELASQNTNVTKHEDRSHGMLRTEIVCTRCDAHLGHVFPDGPAPTGLRYCLNSASLTFKDFAMIREIEDIDELKETDKQ